MLGSPFEDAFPGAPSVRLATGLVVAATPLLLSPDLQGRPDLCGQGTKQNYLYRQLTAGPLA